MLHSLQLCQKEKTISTYQQTAHGLQHSWVAAAQCWAQGILGQMGGGGGCPQLGVAVVVGVVPLQRGRGLYPTRSRRNGGCYGYDTVGPSNVGSIGGCKTNNHILVVYEECDTALNGACSGVGHCLELMMGLALSRFHPGICHCACMIR